MGVLADDPEHDIALVKISTITTPLNLAPSDSLAVGQTVYLIGASRGLDQSLSVGLISAIRQALPESLKGDAAANRGPFVQHTATSAPGSSGSPLIDEIGRVVGVHHSGLRGDGILFAAHVSLLSDLLARTDLSALPKPIQKSIAKNLMISAAVFGVPLIVVIVIRIFQRRKNKLHRRRIEVN